MQTVAKGLAGVIVDQSTISDVRAEGILSYRGHAIDNLATEPFINVAGLVVDNVLDDHLRSLLAPSVNLDERETAFVLAAPETTHPMQLLQSIVPLMSRGGDLGHGEADQGLHVAAKLPAVVATHLTRAPVVLDPDKPYAEAFLAAIGNVGNAQHIAAFNTAQILQLEHSFNAGTFAARVVVSTLACIESGIAAGIGALSGPLHGGADQAVLEIADTLATVADARRYVDETLAQGGKIPGMGHREYRVVDPRARFLVEWAERLTLGTEHESSYLILREIDACFSAEMRQRDKPVHANVDFYKGLVFRVIGLPNHFFTAAFAMARVYGYVAHFIESRQDNRIYRPAAEYVGTEIAIAN
jgi:citrate synthase